MFNNNTNESIVVKDVNRTELVIGDIVTSVSNLGCFITKYFEKGVILEIISENRIKIKIIQSELIFSPGTVRFENSKYIEKIGHVKPFVKEEAINCIKENKYNLLEYDLKSADLSEINFPVIDLYGIDLSGANLSFTNLSRVNLSHVNLSHANLSHANLVRANLMKANLTGANISNADCYQANFQGAILDNIIYNDKTTYFQMRCPEKGSFIGWKKCRDDLIVKLRIQEDAKRSSATSNKCRCSKAEVLAIEYRNGNVVPDTVIARSKYNFNFTYKVGDIIEVDNFDENRWNPCSTGVHFFMTRDEAVNY